MQELQTMLDKLVKGSIASSSKSQLPLTKELTEAQVAAEPAELTEAEQRIEEARAKAKWYVVHTYSGYENKVKADIEKTIENRNLQDEILEVRVPMQEVVEMKNGSKKTVQKKLFPSYVLINMVMNDETWYVVRNTRGVTGFVGPGSKPVPLTEEELKALDFGNEINVEFAEGDVISVTAGVWKDTVGTVQKIDVTRQTVTINVEMFGRETPVEINFSDVKKL